jgi:2-polyprenyl-3-methyl-5-hydroxy-6-metoxy-1,4-benzoquinol methylase
MFLKKVFKKLFRTRPIIESSSAYNFNISNPLGDGGERVDIVLDKPGVFENLDIYQKSHWKRYEFAKKIISIGDSCGDFACGTGYGSVLIGEKASEVIGADINKKVIDTITDRYKGIPNISFIQINLLDLNFINRFDAIISFETLEHFVEEDIQRLLIKFFQALKSGGKLIFSTPYFQEKSDEAVKMGFHQTFHIGEEKIENWLKQAGYIRELFKYQNYSTHYVEEELVEKEFIICVAIKP